MTIKSMTGFGRGESERGGRTWMLEVRCVNHRYLDINIKLPRGYAVLEDRIRKKVAEFHLRGRVDLLLNIQGDFSDLQKITVNGELAKSYRKALAELAAETVLADDTCLAQLAAYPDVLVREQQNEDFDKVWAEIGTVLEQALTECDRMRMIEGESLRRDFVTRLQLFSEKLEKIEELVPLLIEKKELSLQERLDKLLGNIQLDPLRLTQEIAILADKMDVTEELVRLRSHMEQFTLFIQEETAVGRKLDFLIQEFLREVNTMASKINDAEIAHITVDLKSELEKLREQVQNIE